MCVRTLIGVGTNSSFAVRWQSPDLPAPTVTTSDAKEGGSGWIRMTVFLCDEAAERGVACVESSERSGSPTTDESTEALI